MKLLFKFTTRSRPNFFIRGMESIFKNVASENYQILVTVDSDDTSMESAIARYTDNPKVKFCYGTSKNKIDAINRDVSKADPWDIIINMSDDMEFIAQGFDDIIRNSFDNLSQCLHFPDGNTSAIITMSILGFNFYNKFGYIYNPEYESLFCDNEQTDVAKILGVYKFVNMNIFEHKHPAFGKAPIDAQYIHTESFYHKDSLVYEKRKLNNFDL